MALWLFKQEPDEFSFADLEAAGSTVWDGVTNPVAQKHLRAAQPGDKVFYYHTGKEKAIVGIAKVSGGPRPVSPDGKLVTLDIEPVRRLKHPVTLAAIKADEAFAEWELVRIARLSVMPVPAELWKKVEEMVKGPK